MKRIISILLVLVMSLTMCIFSGCGEESEDGITTITWYIPGVLEGADVGMVMDEVNKLLAERYQLKLDLICIDNKNYSSKMQVINAGREEYDLLYVKNFNESITNGVLYDITDLLPEVAPVTYKALDEANWKAVTVDGRIYGVPNWQVQAYASGLMADKSKFDVAGVDPKTVKTTEDLTAYMEKIHAAEPNTNILGPWWSFMTAYYGIEPVIAEKMVGAIWFEKDGKPKVFNQYETDEFKEFVEMRHDWVERGLAADYYEADTNANKKGVQTMPFNIFWWKPGVAEDSTLSNGYEWIAETISPALRTTNAIRATMTGVSTTSKHPKEALKMIEVMYADAEIYNLLCWGIEGKHYTKNEEGKIRVTDNSGYDRISNWKIGPIYNSFMLETHADTLYDDTKEFNDNAIVSPLLGFNFDTTNISTELANCTTVIDKQLQVLELGFVEPKKGIKELNEALKVAGSDKIIKELQKQIDEWWKKNK